MKVYCAMACLLIILVGYVGFSGIGERTDCGIASVETMQDVNQMRCYLSVIEIGEETLREKEEFYANYDRVENVAVVIPTGKIKLYELDVIQEVEVVEIKKGNEELTGRKILLEDGGAGFRADNTEKIPVLCSIYNLMQENTRYLCFFNEIQMYKELRKEEVYHLDGGCIFPVFNLDHTNTTSLLPRETTKCIFGEFADVEFFCYNQKTLNAQNAIKKEVIKKYCGED